MGDTVGLKVGSSVMGLSREGSYDKQIDIDEQMSRFED